MNSQIVKLLIALSLLAGATYSHASFGERDVSQNIMDMVVESAVDHGLAPDLALAVARVESNFDANAISSAGAVGVMQIMPRTGRLEFGVDRESLFDARTNIDTGVRFLKSLYERYGRMDIALSHYNGGSRVRSKSGSLRVIPATKQYVNKVLRYAREYRRSSNFRTMVHAAENGVSAESYTYAAVKRMGGDERSRLVDKLRQLEQKNLDRSDERKTLVWRQRTLAEARTKAEKRRIIERF